MNDKDSNLEKCIKEMKNPLPVTNMEKIYEVYLDTLNICKTAYETGNEHNLRPAFANFIDSTSNKGSGNPIYGTMYRTIHKLVFG